VQEVAELELRLAEEFVVRFAGEKSGDAPGFVAVEGFDALEQDLGVLFLFGGQGLVIHDGSRRKREGEFRADKSADVRVRKKPPTFELLTLADRVSVT
jgi:hypothetical protein